MVNDTVIIRVAFPKLLFIVLNFASLSMCYVKHPLVTSFFFYWEDQIVLPVKTLVKYFLLLG